MAEKRQKTHSILLRSAGKMPETESISLELFDAEQWPDEASAAGLWRVRINDVWHCPTGKYSFLTWAAVSDLIISLLQNEKGGKPIPKPEAAPNFPRHSRVRAHLVNVLMPKVSSVKAPPHQEIDGRWYVWLLIFGHGTLKVPCDDVKLI